MMRQQYYFVLHGIHKNVKIENTKKCTITHDSRNEKSRNIFSFHKITHQCFWQKKRYCHLQVYLFYHTRKTYSIIIGAYCRQYDDCHVMNLWFQTRLKITTVKTMIVYQMQVNLKCKSNASQKFEVMFCVPFLVNIVFWMSTQKL